MLMEGALVIFFSFLFAGKNYQATLFSPWKLPWLKISRCRLMKQGLAELYSIVLSLNEMSEIILSRNISSRSSDGFSLPCDLAFLKRTASVFCRLCILIKW